MGKVRILGLIMGLCLAALASRADALALKDIEPIAVGNLTIWPILDAEGTMEEKLLPGLKDYPRYQGAFSRGPLPGVCQTFLIPIDDKLVLIDTGWGKVADKKGATLDVLRANNISPENIGAILLTHMDFDHIGGLLTDGEATFPRAELWISKPEYDAWTSGQVSGRSEGAMELAKKVAEAYKGRIRLFNFGEQIMPGITAVDASGHTPGHAAFDITSDGQKLTIAGDIIHIWPIQLPLPQLSSIYDMDMEKAAAARKRILDRAADERALLAGMHFPMIGPVLKREDGGYMMREPR